MLGVTVNTRYRQETIQMLWSCHLSSAVILLAVNNVCKAGYFHIRAIRQVRDSLPNDFAHTVAVNTVLSRLDYCNALYSGMPSTNVMIPQRVQKTLAWVVLR